MTIYFYSYRLLQYAPHYYDMENFPDSAEKRALQRIINKKKMGKAEGRIDSADGERNNKKRRKQK